MRKISQRIAVVKTLFIFLQSLNATTLFPGFYDYDKWFSESEKVYSGEVKEIVRSSLHELFPYIGEQLVTIDVYVSWKGSVKAEETLVYIRGLSDTFQPWLVSGRHILVFGKRFESDGVVQYIGKSMRGTFQEFGMGNDSVKALSELAIPSVRKTSNLSKEIFEYSLSSRWSYNSGLGLTFYLENGWYASQKLGYFYNWNGLWAFHLDLGWIMLSEVKNDWVWSDSVQDWYYIYPENQAYSNLQVYSLLHKEWVGLSEVPMFSSLGYIF